MTPSAACPCGSGSGYGSCCRPLHAGEPAPTAERLMRSRFCAFALGERAGAEGDGPEAERMAAYLLRTWDRATRPAELTLGSGDGAGTVWRRLQIVDTVAGGPDDASGVVEFRAAFREGGRAEVLHERSRFRRDGSRGWVYVDGELLP